MDTERDSGLMAAPESELLHEVVRLRNENACLRRKLDQSRIALVVALSEQAERAARVN